MKQQPAIWIDNYKSTTKTIKTSATWNSVKANKKSKAQNQTKLWKKGQSSPIVQMKWGKLLLRTPHTMYRGPKNSNGQSLLLLLLLLFYYYYYYEESWQRTESTDRLKTDRMDDTSKTQKENESYGKWHNEEVSTNSKHHYGLKYVRGWHN